MIATVARPAELPRATHTKLSLFLPTKRKRYMALLPSVGALFPTRSPTSQVEAAKMDDALSSISFLG